MTGTGVNARRWRAPVRARGGEETRGRDDGHGLMVRRHKVDLLMVIGAHVGQIRGVFVNG